MMFTLFDTRQAFRDLAAHGFSEDQADGLTELLQRTLAANVDNLATKNDIHLLRSEIDQLRLEMKIMQQQLTIRMGGIMVVGIGVLAALITFL